MSLQRGNVTSLYLLLGDISLDSLVSEAFVRFFVEIVGHYSLHMHVTEKGERVFQRDPFRKSHTSRNVRHFLEIFMETQMFAGFIQDRELRKSGVKGETNKILLLICFMYNKNVTDVELFCFQTVCSVLLMRSGR